MFYTLTQILVLQVSNDSTVSADVASVTVDLSSAFITGL